jgi:nucleotide-binding universal stress UspA family protein
MEALHVRPDPAELVRTAGFGDYGSGAMLEDMLKRFEEESKASLDRARQQFNTFVAAAGLASREKPEAGAASASASWREEKGDEAEMTTRQARFHDLVVMARPGDVADVGALTLESVLLGSGRPILVMPSAPLKTLGQHVALAWKDSAEAARALAAAMPIMAKASAVTVFEIEEKAQPRAPQPGASLEHVVGALAWHGIKAAGKLVVPKEAGGPDTLLNSASAAGADMIVMGGYGHGRLREMVLGGFTRHMIRHSDLPVLMIH